ncbi:NAD(P)H-hydrate dehydratase [Methylobacterium gossipiicola]|uniref:ADP-dependent (S)-NAD(P)H-hydrate dehydratase n=1 Tax=Methylobacterium gossipiicola TaxID=582675 RepID=A0A1I2UIX7_9HYPH|nr:NAD(P)H-hydrate dehydratase [Methylobacterium gossipiicola]SFG77008.1 yjeF C-terminal region, hydroxyethylthiazole kinase-related [Methylobacterium gossipiicola]
MTTATPVTEHLLRAMPLPAPGGDSKDGRGRVLVVAGCIGLPGAVLLAANAALRAGAGKLQIAVCREVAIPLGIAVPEALVIGLPQTEDGNIDGRSAESLRERAGCVDAVLAGPGMMEDAETQAVVAALIRGSEGGGLVLDAGALVALRADPGLTRTRVKPALITPHAGEMARLLDTDRETVEADPLAAACQASERFGTVTVMKGGRTHVVTPDGRAWCYEAGHIGLAISGSGDTLAGLMVGLLARGAAPETAALWSVHAHGEAGRRLGRRHGGIGYLAREIPGEVPAILAEVGA